MTDSGVNTSAAGSVTVLNDGAQRAIQSRRYHRPLVHPQPANPQLAQQQPSPQLASKLRQLIDTSTGITSSSSSTTKSTISSSATHAVSTTSFSSSSTSSDYIILQCSRLNLHDHRNCSRGSGSDCDRFLSKDLPSVWKAFLPPKTLDWMISHQ